VHVAPSTDWLRPELAEKGTTPDGEFRVTHVFRPDEADGLQAYLVRSHSDRATVGTHFHEVPQYQVFVDGGGTFQRHEIGPGVVHFTDPYSVYGPIVAGPQGLTFFVLRQQFDGGGHYMPGSRDELVGRPGRNVSADGVGTLIDHDADGVGADVIVVAPGETLVTPSPAGTGGQYLLLLDGSASLDGRDLARWSCVHVGPDEAPLRLTAGAGGCRVAVMAFPRPTDVAAAVGA
jgi:hypothetical protein